MKSKIKILHLEDSDLDAELLQSHLEKEGIDCTISRVFLKNEFINAIQVTQFDLILSDNTLPDFDGIDALRLAKKFQPDTPFIFLSGTLGEDVAIEAMRWGAADYILKQKIEKFGVTIKRVIEESRRKKELEEANRKIRENEERVRIGLSTVNIAVFHQDKELKYTWMYQPQLNYKPEQVVGKTDYELLPREAAERITKIKRHVLKTNQRVRDEVTVHWKGETFYFDLVVEPLFDSAGQTIGIIGASLDITEREKMLVALTESEEKFRSLFENAVLGLYRTAPSGEILMVNPALAQMLGYSSFKELKNRNLEKEGFETLYPRARFKEEIESKGIIVGRESVWTKKNGEKIFVRESAKAIKDKSGKILYYEGTVEDITERKKIEEELIAAKEKAEEMDRLKSCFLSNMSHELRTPMIAIMGYSELLQKEISDPEHLSMIEGIMDGATRLNTTLNSILELSKIEAGNAQIAFSVQNIVDEVEKKVRALQTIAYRKNLSLGFAATDKNIYSEINPDLFGNALFQLISNGIKFTKEGGVSVKVTTGQSHGKHVAIVKVKDTGIGISPSQHKKIFGEFVQASQGYSRGFEGSGIGLTIAMKSIQLMKGEITLESEPGKGTSFIISLPLKMNETQLQQEIKERRRTTTIEEPPATSKKMPSILMVEDNISNRDVTKLFLKDYFEINEAADGITALALASKKQFDIVLMDINLGEGIDGIETMKRLRNIRGYQNIPVLAVTAYVMSGDKARLMNCGFDDYVPKPFTKEILIDAIKKKLNVHS